MRVLVFVSWYIYLFISLFSCNDKTNTTQIADINSLDLKKGEIISCGPEDGEIFGSVSFTASVPDSLKKDFNIAIALLHSFEYDQSEKMFAKIIDQSPDCAMAYWGQNWILPGLFCHRSCDLPLPLSFVRSFRRLTK